MTCLALLTMRASSVVETVETNTTLDIAIARLRDVYVVIALARHTISSWLVRVTPIVVIAMFTSLSSIASLAMTNHILRANI
jgi:hypothetical protein